MRCKECLPLLEEYFDGELETAIAGGIAAHVSTCAECASVYAELQADQELYSHYSRELSAASLPWEVLRARIEEERAVVSSPALSAPPARLRLATLGIIRSVFSSRYALAPAFVIAVAIIVGLLIRFNSAKNANHPQLASQPSNVESTGLARQPADNASPIPAGSPDLIAHGSAKPGETEGPGAGNRSGSDRTNSPVESKRANATAGRTRPNSFELRRNVREFSEPASPAESDWQQPVRTIFAAQANDGVGKHVEEAQVLLRSFRSESARGKAEALDLGFEKQRARSILVRNILLRRDAEGRRNLPVAHLLGGLEPVLLDIANIEQRASPDEVRAIVGRMERSGLVAKLQLHALRPAGRNLPNRSLDQN